MIAPPTVFRPRALAPARVRIPVSAQAQQREGERAQAQQRAQARKADGAQERICRMAALLVLVAALSLSLALAPGAALRALAEGVSGNTAIQYEPSQWPFAVSVTGSGMLQFAGVGGDSFAASAPDYGTSMRDGTFELEVMAGQTLYFRAVPDPGATVAAVRVNGKDISGSLGADGTFSLPAENAEVSMDLAFTTVPANWVGGTGTDNGNGSGGIGGSGNGGLSSLTQTGDGPLALVGLLAVLAVAAALAASLARRRTPVVALAGGPTPAAAPVRDTLPDGKQGARTRKAVVTERPKAARHGKAEASDGQATLPVPQKARKGPGAREGPPRPRRPVPRARVPAKGRRRARVHRRTGRPSGTGAAGGR